MKKISVSVGELIARVHKTGDLTVENSHYGRNRAEEGRRVHQWLQKKRQKEYPESYQKEVSLSFEYTFKELEFLIQGRIDGLRSDIHWLEEIKSIAVEYTELDEELKQLYWAQLTIYAYFYARDNQTDYFQLCLSFVEMPGRRLIEESRKLSYAELEDFFIQTVECFYPWAKFYSNHLIEKLSTSTQLEFPYPRFRSGQRDMSAQIYQAIRYAKPIMVQAATGIGKTLASLFPAVKAISKGFIARIVYLSARTTGQLVARDTVLLLRQQGLSVLDLTITAKGKVCFEPEAGCDPKLCVYARNYFSKLNQAMLSAVQKYQSFERENIEELAREFEICPFEFSLNLAHWCDIIICDYNYLYDPRVSLKRFFNSANKNTVVLIDEAHNLVERTRAMYSAQLKQGQILGLKRKLKNEQASLSKQLASVSRRITQLAKDDTEIELEPYRADSQIPEKLLQDIRMLRFTMETILAQDNPITHRDELLDCFFEISHFLNMVGIMDNSFCFIINQQKKQRQIEVYCLSPAKQIQTIADEMQSSVYFSATLAPYDYYADIFADQVLHSLNLPSPFAAEHQLSLLATHISTVYKRRQSSLKQLQELVKQVCLLKKGNYLVFFPSYAYLEMFCNDFSTEGLRLLIQERQMGEQEKERFLQQLQPHTGERQSILALAVMGAGFSEGVDLIGERLIGSIVVGVGLPQLTFHQDLIRDYYQNRERDGFDYAYRYPGISKVLQSAGRVIRSSDDRGFVLLIDSRYNQRTYQQYLPSWWQPLLQNSNHQCIESIREFWKESSV